MRTQFLAFVIVLGAGLGFVGLTVATFLVSLVAEAFTAKLVAFLNWALPFVAALLAFGLTYRMLARVKPAWSLVWMGALFSAALFSIGKWAFGLYLQWAT